MKWNRMSIVCILGAVGVFFSAGCSVFGIRTSEEASYKVLGEYGQFEIREYDEIVAVETDVDAPFDEAGNIAFNRLFGYISGENVAQTKIAMTAPVMAKKRNIPEGKKIAMTSPVIGEKRDKGWRYMFVLPAGYTLESAPIPSDPLVKLSAMPRKKVAVIRYSGSRGEKSIRQKSDELVNWIQSRGLELKSKPLSAGYDPPWTLPFLRRNEVMIDVKQQPGAGDIKIPILDKRITQLAADNLNGEIDMNMVSASFQKAKGEPFILNDCLQWKPLGKL